MAQSNLPSGFQEEPDSQQEFPAPAKSGVRAVADDFVRIHTQISGDVRIRFREEGFVSIQDEAMGEPEEDDPADRVDEDLMEKASQVSSADDLLKVIDEMLIRDRKDKKKGKK